MFWGTFRNPMETHWEQGEKQKIPFPSLPTPNIKEFDPS